MKRFTQGTSSRWQRDALFLAGAVVIFSVLFFLSHELWHVFRVVLGLAVVLFLPGYSFTFLLWPEKKNELERLIVAFLVSFPLIGLTVLLVVRLGAHFTGTTTIATAAILSSVLIGIHLKQLHNQKNHAGVD